MAEDNEEKKSEEQVEKKETTVKHGNPFSAAFKGTLGKGCGCLTLIILFFVGLVFLTSLGKSSKKSSEPKKVEKAVQEENSKSDNEPETERITVSDLMQKNDPNIKRLVFATADYVGKSFTLYAIGEIADYYNYGFRNEMKYYSFQLCDLSVTNNMDCVYAYIDKTNPETKAKELFDILLKESTFLKVDVGIPVEKYQEHSNSFLEITNWEEIPLAKSQ